jgi:hypothetical protein
MAQLDRRLIQPTKFAKPKRPRLVVVRLVQLQLDSQVH